MAGETVNRTTFNATLNRIDVTNAFVADDKYGGDLVATFDFDTSSLKLGKNVLITAVEGTVPGATRSATDVDRVTFEVN